MTSKADDRLLAVIDALYEAALTPEEYERFANAWDDYLSELDPEAPGAARIVAHADLHAERRGDAVGGDVVMGRPDAARGEHMVMAVRKRPHRGADRAGVVADHAHLFQVDAVAGQFTRQMVHVGIAGPARKDLVPDHQHRSGGVWHGMPP